MLKKKKAIKNVITIGLSLCAALTLAPAQEIKANISICVQGQSVDEACGREVYYAISDLLEEIDFKALTLDSSEEINVDGTQMNGLKTIYAKKNELTKFKFGQASERAYEQITEWLKTASAITEMYEGSFGEIKDVETMAGFVKNVSNNIKPGGVWNPGNHQLSTNVLYEAKTALFKLRTFDSEYKQHLSYELQDNFDETLNDFESVMQEYIDEDEELADFIMAFEKILENDYEEKSTRLTSEEAYITGYGDGSTVKVVDAIHLSNKTDINGRINKLKKSFNYSSFKNTSEVESILEEYQSMLDAISSSSDLIKSDSYKAYEKNKTSDENKTVKEFFNQLKISSLKSEPSHTKVTEDIETVMKKLDLEQYKILEKLMNDVIEKSWSYKTKKVGSKYIEQSTWEKGVSTSYQNSLSQLPAILFSMGDADSGKSAWNYISEHMNQVETAIKAVTEDIEKLSIQTLKMEDGKLIDAAYDAIFELTEGGKFAENLTSKEARTIRRTESQVNALKNAYAVKEFTKNGWSNLGNGDWSYNKDGKAFSGWVASGKEWYYVKDGKMLRNSWIAKNSTGAVWYYVNDEGKMVSNTKIQGFSIDLNGEWIK